MLDWGFEMIFWGSRPQICGLEVLDWGFEMIFLILEPQNSSLTRLRLISKPQSNSAKPQIWIYQPRRRT